MVLAQLLWTATWHILQAFEPTYEAEALLSSRPNGIVATAASGADITAELPATTKMGQALETLKPGNAKEHKEKFNLDLSKDYSTDEKCIKCHVTGYGKPGGYVIPDPKDKKAVRKAKKLAGVGCESCHGPGSEYVKLHKEIMMTKRKYKVEEMYAAGMQKIGKETCLVCHNQESPTVQPGDSFDYEKRKSEGIHEHKPLKQREQ